MNVRSLYAGSPFSRQVPACARRQLATQVKSIAVASEHRSGLAYPVPLFSRGRMNCMSSRETGNAE